MNTYARRQLCFRRAFMRDKQLGTHPEEERIISSVSDKVGSKNPN